MPCYYAIVTNDGDILVGNFGEKPPKHLPVPNREPDFPRIKLPFNDESRVDGINRLFAEWHEVTTTPILVRIADDGTAEAWLVDGA